MTIDASAEPASRTGGRTALAGGVGAIGGIGLDNIFKSLGMASLLNNPLARPEYAASILAVVCLLVILLICLVKPPQKGHERYASLGITLFALMAFASLGAQIYAEGRNPEIVITARFRPELTNFKDPDSKNPLQLSLLYSIPRQIEGKQDQQPFADGPEKVHPGDIVEFNYSGLDTLARKYMWTARHDKTILAELKMACSHATKDVCDLLNAQMEDSF